MKICILGSYSGTMDEGMSNISYHIYSNLCAKYQYLILLNVREAKSLKFWNKLIRFKPNLVHYISAPTFKQLIFLKIIQLLTGSRTVVSATQSILHKSRVFKLISFLLKPDIVLVQSEKTEAFFGTIKYRTRFIPNGVDIQKFVPVNEKEKRNMREKYGFKDEDFIILHIGPINNDRNQKALLQPEIQEHCKVLLIVSITNPSEASTSKDISKTNAIIWKQYFSNIQEIYSMVDVYVWPVFAELHGVEIPLTILEAMSCNLPVITTRYGALNRIFQEGDGLIFVNNDKELHRSILEIKAGGIIINTRQKVQTMSWKNITNSISEIYEYIM